MSDYLVYIGTYSSGDEDGIYVYRLDMATGALAYQSSIGGIDNPSFLDIAPNRRFLYAIGETSAVGDRPGGAMAAFAIDQQERSPHPHQHRIDRWPRSLPHQHRPCW